MGLLNHMQLGSTAQNWWWAAFTSKPALYLLLFMAFCMLLMVVLIWRVRKATPKRAKVSLYKRLAGDSGVAMMEFALVTPVIMTIMLLMVQAMLLYTGVFYVQYSAFAAARSAIVHIPAESSEPRNQIYLAAGSEKYDTITRAAAMALLPVSGRESSSSYASDDLVSAMRNFYQQRGQQPPAWVDSMLAERFNYAMNHTEIRLERVISGESASDVAFESLDGQVELSPKEAVSVRVRHEFALTVPLASDIFAAIGDSGTYSPATRSGQSPGPPGQWTMIETRALLTNEGIIPDLPDPPSIPRYR